ncbi:hypothetical protein ACFFNY_09220 [Paenibacillus hodogayensis]|uniref:YmcC n=1 Tax=Paenibacillus hodogayensis TaxID=279208 RepID=A0ABV5VU18_9BACL
MIAGLIVGCEIAFWLFIAAGLACRYLLRMKKTGTLLLVLTPVVDIALLLFTVADLRGGTVAGISHGLAAIYIGVSVAFGHQMIRWADVRFAHRFAGGPPPAKKIRFGSEHARAERLSWLHHLLAWAIGCAILYGMIWFVGDTGKTKALTDMIRYWSIVLGIDFIISFSYTLWPRPEKKQSRA